MDSYEPKANVNRKGRGKSHLADPYLDGLASSQFFDPYDLLCLAIIRQAVKDTETEKSAAYKFWTSDWYDMLTINLPMFKNLGEQIRDQAIRNHREGMRAGLYGNTYFNY